MTRRGGAEVTRLGREQFEQLRRRHQQRLAERVLRVVGTRGVGGARHVRGDDLERHQAWLVGLLGHVRAYWTAEERGRLYKTNQQLGGSVARLILETAGHPLERATSRVRGQAGTRLSLLPEREPAVS